MSALNNYNEVKQKLDEVRMITGDLEFNTAVTFLMQIGWSNKRDVISLCNKYNTEPEENVNKILEEIVEEHHKNNGNKQQ